MKLLSPWMLIGVMVAAPLWLPAAETEDQGDEAMQAQHYGDAFNDYKAAWSDSAPIDQKLELAGKLAAVIPHLDTPPAVLAEADFHAHKAAALVSAANDSDDYLAAADEFRAAISQAPWLSDYQYDLAVCLKSGGKLNEAADALRLAAALAMDDKSRNDANSLLAQIEVAQDLERKHAAAIKFFQGDWSGLQKMTYAYNGGDEATGEMPKLNVVISSDNTVKLVWNISAYITCKLEGQMEGNHIEGTTVFWKDNTGMWVKVAGHIKLTKGGDLLRVDFNATTADGSTTWTYNDFMTR